MKIIVKEIHSNHKGKTHAISQQIETDMDFDKNVNTICEGIKTLLANSKFDLKDLLEVIKQIKE